MSQGVLQIYMILNIFIPAVSFLATEQLLHVVPRSTEVVPEPLDVGAVGEDVKKHDPRHQGPHHNEHDGADHSCILDLSGGQYGHAALNDCNK